MQTISKFLIEKRLFLRKQKISGLFGKFPSILNVFLIAYFFVPNFHVI